MKQNYKTIFFTGATPEDKRRELVNLFQKSNKKAKEIMLLSLGAGCVGINLTAANSMVVCEPDWNPGKEAQCVDRMEIFLKINKPNPYKKLYIFKTLFLATELVKTNR